MGLDICVRRLTKQNKKDTDYFSLADDNGNYNNQNFPEWTKPFEKKKMATFYDWDAYQEKTGIEVWNMVYDGQYVCENGAFMEVHPQGVELPKWTEDYEGGWDKYIQDVAAVKVVIDLATVPTVKKYIKVIYFDEVGYQRRGLNEKFYKDSQEGKIGYFVWTLAELERYKDEYCTTQEDKDRFQSNIIDEFVEGQDCVIFSW